MTTNPPTQPEPEMDAAPAPTAATDAMPLGPSRAALFRLWGLWTLAYGLGAALLGEALIGALLINGDGGDRGVGAMLLWRVIGVVVITLGAAIDGGLQGLALRRWVPSGRQWAIATALPLGIGLSLPLLVPKGILVDLPLVWWLLALVPSCLIASQYMLWRRWVRRPWLWAVLGLPAWGLTAVAVVVVGAYSVMSLGLGDGINGGHPWGLGLFNGAIDGLVAGALKGGIVVWLVRSRAINPPELRRRPTLDPESFKNS